MVRVLIVEDSPTMQALLSEVLSSDPDIKVIGIAANGREGVNMVRTLKPDLVTMDIRMPVMDGFEATRAIMQEQPTPIVVVSASVNAPELNISFNAIRAGALEVVEKPAGGEADFQRIRDQLVTTVKLMAEVKVVRQRRTVGAEGTSVRLSAAPSPHEDPSAPSRLAGGAAPFGTPAIVTIGSSTGGPAALNVVLKALPKNFPLPIVITQHMTAGFTTGLIEWLQSECALPIKTGKQDLRIYPGEIYVAPDNRHMILQRRGILGLTDGPPVSFVRPSVTVLFNSIAKHYGNQTIAAMLTGMGDDGATGMKSIYDSGGLTLAQDQATSVIFGMPKAAIDLGAVRHVLPLQEIVGYILRNLKGGA